MPNTNENLTVALAGESQANRKYLAFARQAEKEGFGQIAKLVKAGQDLSKMDVYLCPVCGDIEFGVLPEKCPICGAPKTKFQKVG